MRKRTKLGAYALQIFRQMSRCHFFWLIRETHTLCGG